MSRCKRLIFNFIMNFTMTVNCVSLMFFKEKMLILYIVLPHFSNNTGLDCFVNFMGGEKYVCTDTEHRSLKSLDDSCSTASTGCLY